MKVVPLMFIGTAGLQARLMRRAGLEARGPRGKEMMTGIVNSD